MHIHTKIMIATIINSVSILILATSIIILATKS